MLHDAIDRTHDMTRLWWDCTQMAADVPLIISMRMMGLSGAWSVSDSEHHDMLHEKGPIFVEAFLAGVLTAWSGQGPDRAMQAAMRPISLKTKDNRARLASGGPRVPGPQLDLPKVAGSL